jgi:hypothetical protein
MKYLKLFEGYQSEAEVAEICQRYGIENWTLNSNGLIDVDGRVDLEDLEGSKLTKLPLKFGHVTCFFCSHNRLTSLEGAPHTVDDDFWCINNDIRSFEGLLNIKGGFYCFSNPIFEIWKIIQWGTGSDTHKWDNEKMEFFNDLDIIHGEEIAIERLNFFLEEMGLEPVESVKGYKNIY